MLGEGYLIINGTRYTPSDFDYSIDSDEEIFKSADGTDLLNITRLNRHIFRLSWEGIDSELLDELEGLCQMPTVTVIYRGHTYVCRARGIDPKLLKKSYKYRRSDGLWDASLTLSEL